MPRPGEDSVLEGSLSGVPKQGDGLVLLGNQNDEVFQAISVKIEHLQAHRAIHFKNDVALEGALPNLLEPDQAAGLSPAEHGHDEVRVAVVVEIGWLDVGDARVAAKEGEGFECAVPLIDQ